MILVWLILVLLLGGILAWGAERWHRDLPRWISLFALTIDLYLLGILILWSPHPELASEGPWLVQLHWTWIPRFGIGFHLAIDGLSLLLSVLTVFLGLMSVGCSWTEIRERVGFFHFNLLWSLSGVLGVFLALDLFLFFFFWELMLVPMYFLIS
ncbi:MAG TPA: NADH-quinone oxidoreductase subunit M, partial [Gammaproteobacteria bacterium]|nr:NADH-quinone oxidoreductase subunit M [Gammaproteobacteria bacterium]